MARWNAFMVEAADKIGRSMRSAYNCKTWMEAQGFVNVVEIVYKWPQNTWPKDKKFKEIGEPALRLLSSLSTSRGSQERR